MEDTDDAGDSPNGQNDDGRKCSKLNKRLHVAENPAKMLRPFDDNDAKTMSIQDRVGSKAYFSQVLVPNITVSRCVWMTVRSGPVAAIDLVHLPLPDVA